MVFQDSNNAKMNHYHQFDIIWKLKVLKDFILLLQTSILCLGDFFIQLAGCLLPILIKFHWFSLIFTNETFTWLFIDFHWLHWFSFLWIFIVFYSFSNWTSPRLLDQHEDYNRSNNISKKNSTTVELAYNRLQGIRCFCQS